MEPATIGLLTTAIQEIVFFSGKKVHNEVKRSLTPDLEAAYKKTIKEVNKKFPKSSDALDRIFKNISIKKKFTSLRGGKENILEYVKSYSKKTLRKKDESLDMDNIIDFFYKKFIEEIKRNDHLKGKLSEAYKYDLIKLVESIKEDSSLIPEIYQEIKSMNNNMAMELAKKTRFKKIKESNFPFHCGAFQLRIYGCGVKEALDILKSSYLVCDEENINNDEISCNIVKEENEDNSLKLIFSGELFKVIYPPQDAIEIWLKQRSSFVELTCFVTNFHKKGEIIGNIKSYAPTGSMIKEITFNSSIVQLLKNYISQVTHLKYNPRIQHQVKIKNGTHTVRGKIAIFSGDPKFLDNQLVQPIIQNLQTGSSKSKADVYFFKVKEVSKIYSKIADFDFHSDGRIVGHFSRKKLNKTLVKLSIFNFIKSHGKEA